MGMEDRGLWLNISQFSRYLIRRNHRLLYTLWAAAMVIFILMTYRLNTTDTYDDTPGMPTSPQGCPPTVSRNNTIEHLEHILNKLQERLKRTSGKCRNLTKPTRITTQGTYFQVHKESPMVEMYLFSAFYDNRDLVGDFPVIRILAVTTQITFPYYCHVWYEGIDHPVVSQIEVKKNGGGYKVRGRNRMEQYLLTCVLSTILQIPTHVSVVPSECQHAQTLLPVQIPSPITKHEVAVCGPLMWGNSINTNVFRVVEWLEMLRELGATEVTLYVSTVEHMSLPVDTMAALRIYEKEGFVDLRYMPGPSNEASWNNVNAGDPAALNDCMYRNMYRYRYAMVLDTDELITPRWNLTYPQLLKFIDKAQHIEYPWHSYTFRNTYFWVGCPGSESTSEDTLIQQLYVLRIQLRQQVHARLLYGPKSIVDPRKCVSVFNHYCYIRFRNLEPPFTIDVRPEIAMNHHYREVHRTKDHGVCENMQDNGIPSDITMKYIANVLPRIRTILQAVGVTWSNIKTITREEGLQAIGNIDTIFDKRKHIRNNIPKVPTAAATTTAANDI